MPIGNPDDMVPRALKVLQMAARVAAEDSRRALKLLKYLGVHSPVSSFHEHSDPKVAAELLRLLEEGSNIALMVDAGTPGVADPGHLLVAEAHRRAIRVCPVPGACAAVVALCVSGLPGDRFLFEGFLPSRPAARQQCLRRLTDCDRTMVFYESPRRIQATVTDMVECFGPARRATLARELSKTHEELQSSTLSEIHAWLLADPRRCLGEMALVVAGVPAAPATKEPALDEAGRHLLAVLATELPATQVARLAARITGRDRESLYRFLHQRS